MLAMFVGLGLVIDLVYKGRVSLIVIHSFTCERSFREVLVRDLAHFCIGSCTLVLWFIFLLVIMLLY